MAVFLQSARWVRQMAPGRTRRYAANVSPPGSAGIAAKNSSPAATLSRRRPPCQPARRRRETTEYSTGPSSRTATLSFSRGRRNIARTHRNPGGSGPRITAGQTQRIVAPRRAASLDGSGSTIEGRLHATTCKVAATAFVGRRALCRCRTRTFRAAECECDHTWCVRRPGKRHSEQALALYPEG
jgi:hypothetical protein